MAAAGSLSFEEDMKAKNVFKPFIVMLVLAVMPSVTTQLGAQSIVSGEVTGTLTDPSGAVVPGATVTLKNRDTGATQTTVTNGSGSYRFSFLMPGTYDVNVTRSGFQPITSTVQVAVGQSTRSDMKLAVGGSSQTIEVTA
jgi:hypothetical protein